MESIVQYVSSPVGTLLIRTDGKAVIEISFAPTKSPTLSSDPILGRCAQELREYFDGSRTSFDVPIRAEGTPFQQAVWKAMSAIKKGTTSSYAKVARQAGHPKAARAVGTACKKNPIAVVIPCHRVVASHGFGGYNGGLDRKKWLLKHEKS